MEYDIINNYDLKEEYTRKSNGQNSSTGKFPEKSFWKWRPEQN